MLLASNMDPCLLARVELGVADAAVVLEGRSEGNRANHTPEQDQLDLEIFQNFLIMN